MKSVLVKSGVKILILPWIISWLLVSCIASEEVEDVIHLDLSPLRGDGIAESSPSSATEYVAPSLRNASRIYCSDTTFPSDIFCDLSTLNRTKIFRQQMVTKAIYFEFPHPSRSTALCYVGFKVADDNSSPRLVFNSTSCYDPAGNGEEWIYRIERAMRYGELERFADTYLPENLKVEDVTFVEIEDRGTENLSTVCRRRFRKVDSGVQESLPSSSVAFESSKIICISSAPPIMIPRQTELNSVTVKEPPQA